MIIFFWLILNSFSIHALECVIPKETTNGFESEKIPDETKMSLFDQGGVLSSFKTQDQDGMGTCYANALTVAIKAAHKDHPDISYLHASLMGTSTRLKGDKDYLVDPTSDKLFNWGGSACENFEELKQKGGACDVGSVSLENDYRQESMLKNVGRFIDYFSHPHEHSRGEFKKTLDEILEKKDKANLELLLACLEEKEKGFSGSEVVDQWIRVALLKKRTPECRDLLLEVFRKLFTPTSIIREDRISGELNPELISKLRTFFSAKEVKKSFLKFSTYKAKSDFQKMREVSEDVVVKLETMLKTKAFSKKCPEEDLFSPEISLSFFTNLYEQELGFKGFSCDQFPSRTVIDKMKRSAFYDESSLACLPEPVRVLSKEILASFQEFETFFGKDFLNKLFTPKDDDSFSNLGQLLFPRCQEKANLISLNGLSCSWVDLRTVSSMEKVKETFQRKVFPLLKKDLPVMISVCTSFLKNTEFKKTNQCKDNSNSIKGHTHHALAISGYRCKDGKIQYQIQNSWGSTCPIGAGPTYKNSYLECELDKRGRPLGRFWVDEEVLLDSTMHTFVVQSK